MEPESQSSVQRRGLVGWLARHPILSVLAGLVACFVGVAYFADRYTVNRVQQKIAELRRAGEPVSIEDLYARDERIPDDENLSVGVHTAAIDLQIADADAVDLPYLGTVTRNRTGEPLPEKTVAAMRSYLHAKDAGLQALHAALRRKRAAAIFRWGRPALGSNFPQLTYFRLAAKALAIEVANAAEAGDREAVTNGLLDLFTAGHALDGRNTPVVGHLVRVAIVALACDATDRAINRVELDASQLLALQNEMSGWTEPLTTSAGIDVERVLFLDFMSWMDAGNHAQSPILPGFGIHAELLRFAPALRSLDFANALEQYRKLQGALRLPEPQITPRLRELESAVHSMPELYFYSQTLLPGLARFAELKLRGAGETRALMAAVGCERFRLAHGRWPNSLAETVPEFLTAAPRDPFDGRSIRFAIIPEGIKCWTIGEDLADNGGNIMGLEAPSSNKRPTDCGFVILNPGLRGLTNPPTTNPS